MPGLKRRHGSNDGPTANWDEDHEDSSNRSSPPRIPEDAKRLRLSDIIQIGENTEEETDEENRQQQNNEYHLHQKSRVTQENKPAENGIIESITCTNFMCHSFVHVEIGPLINWVIGHNGSGKSAILTALTVCLGGKASATNRAGSLRAFVKEGTDSCTLCVKIKNAGENGYHPDLWGESITVERTFNRTGTSGFKLKNSAGRTISTKRSDLEDISDFYALQLDNPISVLTQDNARQFLNSASPTDKYKFFVRGVQLEQLNQDYELLAESIAQIESTFDEKSIHVEELKQKKAKAKSLLDLVNQQENIRSRIMILGVQMAWSQVEDQEKILKRIEEDLQKIETEIARAKLHAEALAEKLSDADKERALKENERENIESKLEEMLQDKMSIKERYDAVKAEAVDTQKEQRKIADEIRAINNSIAKSKEQIEAEKERLEQINGGSHERKLAELERAKDEVDNARRNILRHNETLSGLVEDKERAVDKFRQQEGPTAAKEQEIRACENRLRDLQGQGNQRRGYPPGMDRLINSIRKEKRFSEEPVGPLADHIRIIEPMWSSILEKSFGGVLNGFIVTNKVDQSRLSSIMRATNCMCPIFIGSTQSFDFSNHEPDTKLLTVLRVLEIDNDLVKRQLIVNQMIEQTLLIEDSREARELLTRTRPENVKQCYSMNPAQSGAGLRTAYGRGNALNSSYIEPFNGPPRMRQQTQTAINYEQTSRARLQRELDQIKTKTRELNNAVKECQKSIERHSRDAANLKISLQRAEQERDELQEAIDHDTIEEGRLEVLKANLKTHEQEKLYLEKRYGDAVIEKDKHNAMLSEVHEQLNEADAGREKVEHTLKAAKKQFDKAVAARQALLLKNNEAWDKVGLLQAERENLELQRSEMSEIVAEFNEKASKIGPRVPIESGETTESIDKKLTKLDEDIKRHEQRLGGNKEQIAKNYGEASQNFAAAREQFEAEQKLCQLLMYSLMTRKERWQQFRRKISARARATFVHVLSERNFHGTLLINHKEKRLDIQIQPDATQLEKQGREANSLSGGEKSYSTICLLLSLWDAVGAPIRCLDEFDVFMDGVNREITMKLLTSAARTAVGRQFLLISPQAGVTDTSPDVKIIKMPDPVRNQSRIVL